MISKTMDNIAIPEKSNELELQEFLLDIECLDLLSPWTNKFNLFEVLKISRAEIKHSNMLAWLLDPNERHGLSDMVLRGVIQNLISNAENLNFDIFSILLMDFHSFFILREWNNIDLLAVSNTENFVLCIENKIGSSEHNNQLNRYFNVVSNKYKNYKKLFVYLTPDGEDASDQEHWQVLSYRDILRIITTAKDKVELLPDIKLLIENYIETIRRNIVGDEKLVKICNEIYTKHRKALDLIYEYRPDDTYNTAKIIWDWCSKKAKSGVISFDLDKTSKTYIRFTTPTMTKILPEGSKSNSGWKSKNYYNYEIRNLGDKFKVMLSISSLNIPEEQRRICDRLISILKPNDKKTDWVWKRLKTWNWFELKDTDSENEEEVITKKLDEYLEDIKKFENKLLKRI